MGNDATLDALRRIEQDGSDLTRPLSMDFFVAVPDQASGSMVASRAEKLGFSTSVEQDSDTEAWTCYCTKQLVPAYESVVALESLLSSLAADVGGYTDGFGTFGNAESDPSELFESTKRPTDD
ncbi:MAG: ribonuclease E inhibitor RraB [Polyangiaceae bacterium]